MMYICVSALAMVNMSPNTFCGYSLRHSLWKLNLSAPKIKKTNTCYNSVNWWCCCSLFRIAFSQEGGELLLQVVELVLQGRVRVLLWALFHRPPSQIPHFSTSFRWNRIWSWAHITWRAEVTAWNCEGNVSCKQLSSFKNSENITSAGLQENHEKDPNKMAWMSEEVNKFNSRIINIVVTN